MTRQKVQEEAVRKAILARKAFNPTVRFVRAALVVSCKSISLISPCHVNAQDLKKWLDSDDTCSLPEPSLGVRIRQDLGNNRQ